MFASSVSRWKTQFKVSTILRYYYHSSCHNHCSFTALHGFRKSPILKCVKSIPIGVFWIWPLFRNLGDSAVNRQPMSTQASASSDSNDQVLNQILCELLNSTDPCLRICESHVERLCSVKDLLTAASLVQSFCDKEIFISPNACNCLLKAAAEKDDFDILLLTFKNLLVSPGSVNSDSFLIVANALGKKNDDEFLLRFVREVSELTFPRNLTILNRIIYAFGECRQVPNALLVFEHMKNLNCEIDLVTFNTILRLLGWYGRIDDMLYQFGSMKWVDILPDTISYNTILNNLRKVGSLDLCSAIFKEMGEQGVEPDLQTYTTLIDSCWKSGNVEEALRNFHEMKHRRIRLSIYVYRSLINRLNKMGKVRLAAQVSKEMDWHISDLAGPRDFKRKKK